MAFRESTPILHYKQYSFICLYWCTFGLTKKKHKKTSCLSGTNFIFVYHLRSNLLVFWLAFGFFTSVNNETCLLFTVEKRKAKTKMKGILYSHCSCRQLSITLIIKNTLFSLNIIPYFLNQYK